MEQCSNSWLIGLFFLGWGLGMVCSLLPFKWSKFRWLHSKEKHIEYLKERKTHIQKIKNDIDYRSRSQFGSSLAIILISTLATLLGVFSKIVPPIFFSSLLITLSIAFLILACYMVLLVMKDIDRVRNYYEFVKQINREIRGLENLSK